MKLLEDYLDDFGGAVLSVSHDRYFLDRTCDRLLIYEGQGRLSFSNLSYTDYLEQQAEAVRRAIYAHCVFRDTEQKPYFGWSVDLKGQHNVYDEPPGSLQLLPYYGFCAPDDEIWGNTVAMIRAPSYAYSFADAPIAEIGCAHAPYP